MNRFVLDASALLALLYREPGIEKLPQASDMMRGGVMSSVNLAEVHGKLVKSGMPEREAWEAVMLPVGEIADFSPEQARQAGALILQTSKEGLSLGDRACLALAMELGAPVYTTDRAWSRLSLDVAIHVIR